jgi:hypothetical protein
MRGVLVKGCARGWSNLSELIGICLTYEPRHRCGLPPALSDASRIQHEAGLLVEKRPSFFFSFT